MTGDGKLKSAYELAMERLRAKDREEGVDEPTPLTDEQKRRIAELRAEAQARLAELEILRKKTVAEAAGDPEKLAEIEEKYGIDRGRIESRLESKIDKVRDGGS
jgi:hypothetical protein